MTIVLYLYILIFFHFICIHCKNYILYILYFFFFMFCIYTPEVLTNRNYAKMLVTTLCLRALRLPLKLLPEGPWLVLGSSSLPPSSPSHGGGDGV